MNFYLDFEATQFSERIISIGCVSDTGAEFGCLVRPPKGDKVNAFITNLTGITQEMVEHADCADVCFIALREFIRRESKGEETFFFAYGFQDRVFIDRTVTKMFDSEAKKFAYKLGASLIDFSAITQRFFRTGSISLKNAVAYFRQEEVAQNHHATDDAELLRELVYMVNHCDMPDTLFAKPTASKKKTSKCTTTPKLTMPEGYTYWHDVPESYFSSGTILRYNKAGKLEKPFASWESVYKYINGKYNGSLKKDMMKKNIEKAIAENHCAFSNRWKIIE